MQDAPRRRAAAPYVAAALALAYPAAVAAGVWALAGVTVAAAVAGCAVVVARRPSVRLRLALAAITAWLALGIAGALLLRGHTLPGFVWVLLVLYAVPLPLVPWIYAKTFAEAGTEGRGKRVDGRGTTSDGHVAGRSSSLFPLPSHQPKRDP